MKLEYWLMVLLLVYDNTGMWQMFRSSPGRQYGKRWA